MAFFLGVAEGLDRERDRQLKREMWLGDSASQKAMFDAEMNARRLDRELSRERLIHEMDRDAADDERQAAADAADQDYRTRTLDLKEQEIAMSREEATQRRLFQSRLSTLDTINTQREQERVELREHLGVVNNFQTRLESTSSPELRKAYLNTLKENPEVAAELLSQIQSHEDKGVRIEGDQLVELFDVVSETKPDDYSMEEWIAESAGRVVDMAAGVTKYDNMYAAALDVESEEEMAVLEMEAARGWSPDGTPMNLDIDWSDYNVDVADINNVDTQMVNTAKAEFDSDLQYMREQVAAGEMSPEDPSLQALETLEQTIATNGNPEVLLDAYGGQYGQRAYNIVSENYSGLGNIQKYSRYAPPVAEVTTEQATPETTVATPAPAQAGQSATPVATPQAQAPTADVIVPPPIDENYPDRGPAMDVDSIIDNMSPGEFQQYDKMDETQKQAYIMGLVGN